MYAQAFLECGLVKVDSTDLSLCHVTVAGTEKVMVGPEAEKTARIVALQGRQKEIQAGLHDAMVGRTVRVLVDSVSRRRDAELSGRTDGNTVVNFAPDLGSGGGGVADNPGLWLGRTVPILVTRAGPHSVSGELVGPAAEASVGAVTC